MSVKFCFTPYGWWFIQIRSWSAMSASVASIRSSAKSGGLPPPPQNEDVSGNLSTELPSTSSTPFNHSLTPDAIFSNSGGTPVNSLSSLPLMCVTYFLLKKMKEYSPITA
ncbi:hypothetical protein VPH35_106801 [Triticum aestivum]